MSPPPKMILYFFCSSLSDLLILAKFFLLKTFSFPEPEVFPSTVCKYGIPVISKSPEKVLSLSYFYCLIHFYNSKQRVSNKVRLW